MELNMLIDNNQISLALAALYFLISSNYLGELFTCSLRKALTNNMINKHILAIITLYISIMMTTKIEDLSTRLVATAIVYFWFLITTKCTANYVLAIIIIIVLTYIIKEIINNTKKNKEENEYYDNLNNKISKASLFICIVISIIGFIIYYNKQKKDYGNNFNFSTFIFGVQNCK